MCQQACKSRRLPLHSVQGIYFNQISIDKAGKGFTLAWSLFPFFHVGQDNPTQHNTTQPKPAQPNPTQPKPAQPSPAQPNPRQPNPTQHNSAQPNPTQHNPNQPNPTQDNPTQARPLGSHLEPHKSIHIGSQPKPPGNKLLVAASNGGRT